jgi:hypothetical protein
VALLRIPIDIVYPEAVGERAAQSIAARETVEPGFQRRIGVATIVTHQRDDPHAADGWRKSSQLERAGRGQ